MHACAGLVTSSLTGPSSSSLLSWCFFLLGLFVGCEDELGIAESAISCGTQAAQAKMVDAVVVGAVVVALVIVAVILIRNKYNTKAVKGQQCRLLASMCVRVCACERVNTHV